MNALRTGFSILKYFDAVALKKTQNIFACLAESTIFALAIK
jgi:hypothetical protein